VRLGATRIAAAALTCVARIARGPRTRSSYDTVAKHRLLCFSHPLLLLSATYLRARALLQPLRPAPS
jgi:hypothetical protein